MIIADKIRRIVYWTIDYLKLGPTRSHYVDIKFILENCKIDSSIELRRKYLSEVLKHAISTTPYYHNIKAPNIFDFPIIDKNLIRNNFDAFKTKDPNYKCFVSVVTSGSTGTPFSICHDKRKRQRNTADTIFFSELAGFKIGYRLYYFKIWNKINRKSKLSTFFQNIVPYDVFSLNDYALSLLIKKLKDDMSIKGLLGYSSVYESLVNFLQKSDSSQIFNNTKSIISMSEALSKSAQQAMSYYFNTNVVSRYSNVENGIIAQQLSDGSEDFLINEASYFVEVLEIDSDNPVPIGIPGRIVVTDLFNYCMPMIRYDTGDIGILTEKQVFSYSRLVFKSIEGRRMDMIYDTSGSLVSSFVITNNMWKFKEVKQYQFIQNSDKDYLFKINTDLPFNRADELIKEFKGYFGDDSNISIEYINEIPLLESGKRKKVINNNKK